jgi:hypothetical protein
MVEPTERPYGEAVKEARLVTRKVHDRSRSLLACCEIGRPLWNPSGIPRRIGTAGRDRSPPVPNLGRSAAAGYTSGWRG